MIGQVLGPYRILETLGEGGMGVVYRARDTRLDRDVAIKILPDALASDAGSVARFQREARAVAALNHPNIVTLHSVAKGLSVLPRRINEIVLAKRAVTADTALRLARFVGTSDRFWLNLQAAYDLDTQRDRLGSRLETEVKVLRRAS
jgi:antitoxin HigA-1